MPIRQVEWPEAAHFAALQSQLYDFDLALSALGRISHYSAFAQMDLVILHSLYAIALIYYARIFKSGVREACAIDSLGLTREEHDQHDRLIASRDKWLAHSVNAFDQVAVGIILSGFTDNASVVDVARLRLRKLAVSVEKAQHTEDFIRSIRQRIEVKNNDAYQDLLTRAKSASISELQRYPEISVLAPATDLQTASRRR